MVKLFRNQNNEWEMVDDKKRKLMDSELNEKYEFVLIEYYIKVILNNWLLKQSKMLNYKILLSWMRMRLYGGNRFKMGWVGWWDALEDYVGKDILNWEIKVRLKVEWVKYKINNSCDIVMLLGNLLNDIKLFESEEILIIRYIIKWFNKEILLQNNKWNIKYSIVKEELEFVDYVKLIELKLNIIEWNDYIAEIN